MMKRLFLTLFCLLMASAAWGTPSLQRLHERISAWHVVEARAMLVPLLLADPSSPSVRFAEGRLLFFEGHYEEAVAVLESIINEAGDATPKSVTDLRDRVKSTFETLKSFDEFESPDGRFLIRYSGRDALMVPYVYEVLSRQDKALAKDFAYTDLGRVVVELYPRIETLAAVSPLTEKDIETSGTIALCKYNRLMFTSPRALVRGYGWRDTMAHEFVHYYINKVSGNTVPIWLHEGIAKLQESRWRAAPDQPLEPPDEDLLARSVKIGELITFEQMHPSMALLPSQEAASLAYTQVHTVLRMLYQEKGYAGLRGLMAQLAAGEALDGALQATYGVDLAGLWRRWRAALPGMNLKTYKGLKRISLKFKRPGQSEEPEADYGTIEEKRVRDLAHLGELLRARGRHGAALKEYRKAMLLGGDGNPSVQNGAAASLLFKKQPTEVPALLERVTRYYPSYLTTWVNLGEAYAALDQPLKAMESYERAQGINPFYPRLYEALVKLYTEAGRVDDAARAQASLELLR